MIYSTPTWRKGKGMEGIVPVVNATGLEPKKGVMPQENTTPASKPHISQAQIIARSITERDWQETVVELAQALGWKVYWTWSSIHSPAGFPDLVLVHPEKRRLIFAELKTERGKVPDVQWMWLCALKATGKCEVYLWRPSQLEEITAMLKGEKP